MKEIGELLREAREEKGITLEQISNDTKIPVRLLQDLEQGNFSRFAGKVYLKGALRNYGEYIGLDAQELFSLYNRVVEQNDLSNQEVVNSGGKGSKKKKPLIKMAKKPFPMVALVWIAVLIFVVGGSIWYRYDQGVNNGEKVPYPGEFLPDELDEDNNEYLYDNKNDFTEPPVQTVDEPVLTLHMEDSRQATYILKEAEEKEIVLLFTGDCWISIQQDGRFVQQGTFSDGQQHRIGDARETTIRFGNPPVASILVNGQAISLSGITNPFNVTIRREE